MGKKQKGLECVSSCRNMLVDAESILRVCHGMIVHPFIYSECVILQRVHSGFKSYSLTFCSGPSASFSTPAAEFGEKVV